ncbi:MAG: hypothetical protein ACFFER_17840 [Candidatus Thorarchaeota archaeon]
MKLRRTKKETYKQFAFPAPMYFIAKIANLCPTLANIMNRTESIFLRKQVSDYAIDRLSAMTARLILKGATHGSKYQHGMIQARY